jgi:uncharacterized protein YbjT (DUF2867 family)
MAQKNIIAVVGATGAQGGGLARAILNDAKGPFALRAITRKVDSDKAKALAAAGAELVAADLDDAASLRRAFAGAYGAFCVTNFWEHFTPAKEMAQAKAMAEAARTAGLQHVVWSTLEDTRKWVPLESDSMPTLMGEYKVPHFDSKGASDPFFADAGVPTTNLLSSFYWDNLIHFGMGPRPGEDGELVFALPMGERKLPGIAAADIGPCAYGIFKRGAEFVGKTVGIAGEHLSGEAMAAALGKALGRRVRYVAVSFATYRSLDFPGAEDLGNMFQFKHDFEGYFCGARSVEQSRRLHPGLQDFSQWLAANKDQIALSQSAAG